MRGSPPHRVAVIGGGLSGLATAAKLCRLAPDLDVQLFEGSGRDTRCTLSTATAFAVAHKVDFFGNVLADLSCDGNTVPLSLHPFEICSIRLRK